MEFCENPLLFLKNLLIYIYPFHYKSTIKTKKYVKLKKIKKNETKSKKH